MAEAAAEAPGGNASENRALAEKLIEPLRRSPGKSWADLAFFSSAGADGLTAWERLHARLMAADQPWQPAPERLFRALELTPRDQVKAVILGQDPYHTPGRAQGLAFGFPPDCPPRDSLRNILAELAADSGQSRADGDLSGWARQGVLLLNTLLSVPVSQALGHKGWGWEALTREILEVTASDGPRAFVLWGGPAAKLCAGLGGEGHLILSSAHPSPLSARRGFFGSRPFSAVNAWLRQSGRAEIDWLA